MLERLNPTHAQDIYDYMTNEAESPDVFFPRPETLADTLGWIDSLEGYAYTVILEGKASGVVTFKPITGGFQAGFYFKVSARGRIYPHVKEAMSLMDEFTLVATPYLDNVKCARFLTKLGFHFSHSEPEYDVWTREERL